jgi:predicted phage tail protein
METSLIPCLNHTAIVSIAEATPAAYELPEIPPTLTTRPVRILVNDNPFKPEEHRVFQIAALDNESVEAILYRADITFNPSRTFTNDEDSDQIIRDYKCSLNGSRIPDEELRSTPVQPGDEIVLFPRAAGGKVWEMVSMLALTVLCAAITAGAGGIGFLAFLGPYLTTGMAAAISAGVGMVGSLLISWAFSPGQQSSPAWSASYDPTGPKGLAQPGVPVPKGYGKMGWCGNVISSYVSFDGKDAYINCLVCYGWGQAVSISNVLINQQPISVFSNCSYQVRLGTNNQTSIDGFDRTVNGYPVEQDLLVANGPIVVQGTGTNVQGLDITVKFPSGLYRVTNDGNDVPLKFIYLIEVSPHNANTWTAPLFANNTQTVATTNGDGTQTWPAWVVVPTDRFAGSGIVYASDNGSHTPGDAWSNTETVTTVNLDGSPSSTSATFNGEWQPCDPNLNQALVTNWWQGYRVVQDCTFSAFFDTVSVYGLTAGQWDVRVTKMGYEGDRGNNPSFTAADSPDAQHVCDGWLWNINEIFWSNLSYPNMILVGVKALATSQLNGGSIQLMATVTHDIGADTVLPALLSGFEHDNPAVVCYDMLTNPLYGMAIAPNLIDLPAFNTWAAFNDELVTNQDGTQVRRHVFAGTFDQAGDAWHALGIIAGMARASIIQLGMRYTVILDAPGDPVQLFTIGNTKKDSFQEQWMALDDRCTLIECDFADAARNYRMDLPVSVMTATDINSGLQPKVTRTKLTGCTSRDQAWRWAYFHLMSTKLTLRTVQFSAPIEAVCCQLGSVIALQSDVVQWGVGGRVQPGSTLYTLNIERTDLTFVPAAGYTVSVQHPVVLRGTATIASVVGLQLNMTAPIPAGRIVKAVAPDGTEYIVTGYGGSAVVLATATGLAASIPLAAGQVVTLYDGNVIDNLNVTGVTVGPFGSQVAVSGSFSAVPITDSAWAYGQSAGYQPAKLFRVVSIKKSGDFAFDIGAMEYNAEIYEDVIPNYGEIVGVPDSSPAILNLSLTEQYQNGTLTGSANTALVAVGWMNGNTAVGGQVQVQASGGAWNTIGNIQGQGCTFVGYIGTTYNVKVTGFDWQGNLLGTPATASITVEASSNAPANVTGFSGLEQSGGSTILSWTAVTGADHYEIRYTLNPASSTWIDSEVLWDGTGTTWTDSAIRTGVYMIVAVSSLATGSVESVTPATWQYTTTGVGINPRSIAPTSVVWPMCGVSVTSAGGTLTSISPYGSGLNRAGALVAIPNVSMQLNFVASLAANTAYFIYFYLDTNLTLQTPNAATGSGANSPEPGSYNPILFYGSSIAPLGNLGMLDVGYNNAHASACLTNGLLAWYYTFTTDGSGNVSNPEMIETVLSI